MPARALAHALGLYPGASPVVGLCLVQSSKRYNGRPDYCGCILYLCFQVRDAEIKRACARPSQERGDDPFYFERKIRVHNPITNAFKEPPRERRKRRDTLCLYLRRRSIKFWVFLHFNFPGFIVYSLLLPTYCTILPKVFIFYFGNKPQSSSLQTERQRKRCAGLRI